MKVTTSQMSLLGSALLLCSGVEGVVQMGIQRVANPSFQRLKSRATFTSSLINNATGGSYMINVSVGTPAQPVSLVLDTGSADVFVLDVNADQCTSARIQREYGPCVGGTYNPTTSSSYKLVNTQFSIQYADNSGSKGDYINETLAIGSNTISNLQMGLALNTTTGIGIMGIGYDTNEASRSVYPNVIDQMVTQGLIPIKAYSLYLDDLQASTGSILFGGVDTAKYTGSLVALPLTKGDTGSINAFYVALTSVSVTGQAGNSSAVTAAGFSQSALLDSGTTITYLPDASVNEIYSIFNIYDDTANSGIAFIDCTLVQSQPNAKVVYSFGGSGGPSISVPLSELVLDLGLSPNEEQGLPFASSCSFGIQGAGDGGTNILGDTFLRSAYVVYDISNNQVALAQSSFNQTSSNVQAFAAGAAGIPGVSSVASAVTAAAFSTVTPGVGVSTKVTQTQTVLATITSTPVAAGSSAGTSAGATSVAPAASSSKAAAASGPRPPFDHAILAILAGSGLFALLGGALVLA